VIKSRRIRLAGYVAREGREVVCTWFGKKTLSKRAQWGDPGVDGRILLRRIFRK
jgi:hypothetical protein